MERHLIEGNTFNLLYRRVVEHVLSQGAAVAPREIPTLEARVCTLRLEQARARVLTVPGRIPNPAFAVAEAIWVLSGSDAPWIFEYNEALRRYTDDGVLRGAYGPRLRCWAGRLDQLELVRNLLTEEPHTRRAAIQIFDPARDWLPSRDVPCTIGHRFLLRDGALHMHSTMRSQDVWLGLPYDVFTNTVLQELMAGWIGVAVGEYVHTVDSLHLYHSDMTGAIEVVASPDRDAQGEDELDLPLALPFESLDLTLEEVRTSGAEASLPTGWSSYAATLSSYRAWKAGRHDEALDLAADVCGPLAKSLGRWYEHLSEGAISLRLPPARHD